MFKQIDIFIFSYFKINLIFYGLVSLVCGFVRVLVIKSILRCFELASGLKVNFFKSKIGGVGISQSQL